MTGIDVKSIIHEAIGRLLYLVVKLSLRNGLTYQELTAISKRMFVDVAAKDFGIQGRPTNVSRIALLTGLDRKEVKRIKDLLADEQASKTIAHKQDRVSRVISAWFQDPEFLTPSGKPTLLKRSGDTKSFSSLAKRFGGDVPEGALLKEMQRVGVVEETPSGKIKLIKRTYIPDSSSPEALSRAAEVIRDLGKTLFHNLYESDAEKHPLRFERRAHNRHMDPAAVDDFRQFVNVEGQAFLERVDAWLTEHELSESQIAESESAESDIAEPVRLGVGTYLIVDDETEGKSK